jgi:hypothetical protein
MVKIHATNASCHVLALNLSLNAELFLTWYRTSGCDLRILGWMLQIPAVVCIRHEGDSKDFITPTGGGKWVQRLGREARRFNKQA